MSNYRNQAILDHANDAPYCMSCWRPNAGNVVGCHSNSQKHGKGMGIKAHDVVAYLCHDCHDRLDGRKGALTRAEKELMFLESAYETIVWLLKAGCLKVCK